MDTYLTEVCKLTLRSRSGAHIFEVKREALALCLEHQCNVEFWHNQEVYAVKYEDLLSCVYEGRTAETKVVSEPDGSTDDE